ncbi:MAG: alcohol dehydrogenase catalytic domain-containing protein [Planctomycetota bacterium]
MLAATFRGPHSISSVEKPEPRIESPGDAIVRVELAGLCGSDLHPYRGREKGLDVGTTMGHEFTGTIVAIGDEVRNFHIGDAVLSPFSSSCGHCSPCGRGLTSRCSGGDLFGWLAGGRGLEGGQAELVRVPLADGTLVARPDELDPIDALLLGDVVSTGYHIAERAKVGTDTPVAVVGLGAVGLSAVLACHAAGAPQIFALDSVEERLERARGFGAIPIDIRGPDGFRTPRQIGELVKSQAPEGVAVALEAVGTESATAVSVELLRPGGHLSIAGVHTESHFALSPELAYDKNLTLSIGRCPARAGLEERVKRQIESPQPFSEIVTHRVPLTDASDAYQIFDQRVDGCVKLVFETS